MPYSSPATVVTGTTITSTWGNSVKTAADYLANPPACRVYNSAVQTPATATLTAMAFNSERYDTNTMHDTVTNNSRITFTTAGLYVITGHVQFASNATGFRGLMVWANATGTAPIAGGTRIASEYRTANNGDFTEISITTTYKFAAAEWVQLVVYQTSTVGLNVNSAANYSPEFSATWVGLG